MARTAWLGLEETLRKWNKLDGLCKLCKDGRENIIHFLFTCPHFLDLRIKIWHKLEESLIGFGHNEEWYNFISSSLRTKFMLFMGNAETYENTEVEDIFDGACRQYLKEAWHMRDAALNDTG